MKRPEESLGDESQESGESSGEELEAESDRDDEEQDVIQEGKNL